MNTVVLIHGLAGSPGTWDSVTPLIRHDADRIIAPSVGRELSIEAEADAVARRIGRGHEPAVLVGHSMGGLIATAVAERYPELVDRLILVNTPPSIESRLSARSGGERILALPVVGEIVWHLLPDSALAKGAQTSFAPGTDVPSRAVRDLRATGRRAFVRASANIDAYLFDGPLRNRLDGLTCPVDVVFGELDQRVDPASFAALRNDDHITATPIPDAGHMTPWESPSAVADAIRRVLIA
ncbi:alpha/beta fold hydrolase [Nocardioides jejuensis]|uniref:Alpha/beta hydrolase n=1 Tax=Nocardioides jejuensis TaxID=2502782 RepID=A0A4V2NZX0_9ACTN|nr:alpha/beta hydrolase [Nocardioides jejuensis]TCJ30632.1 alpha/beta hydrolase [Nocardioides jejuensis]